jgi:hypothetical protein
MLDFFPTFTTGHPILLLLFLKPFLLDFIKNFIYVLHPNFRKPYILHTLEYLLLALIIDKIFFLLIRLACQVSHMAMMSLVFLCGKNSDLLFVFFLVGISEVQVIEQGEYSQLLELLYLFPSILPHRTLF